MNTKIGVRMYKHGEVRPNKGDIATCRGCERSLKGPPYYMGKGTSALAVSARVNYYGGFVCSRACDISACSELEDSMPGHGYGSSRLYGLDPNAKRSIESNWGES
jgi:hypothetical protein